MANDLVLKRANMKVLFTGAGSYVGSMAAAYISDKDSSWDIFQLDVQLDDWINHDFSQYDAVFHVAGLAHRKITPEIEPLYYKVNRDLAINVAIKAKNSGVKHFIFMSSMSVYSDDTTYIDINTPTKPDNAYGKSKLQAEEEIRKLQDENFIISIIRPPMIYGKGCKGNYNSLRSIALKYPIFPKVNNKRSMLYIDNFSEFLYQLIIHPCNGIFFPQNKELVNTTNWVELIAKQNGKRVHVSCLLGVFAKIGKYIPIIKNYCLKAFGDCYYDESISLYPFFSYQVIDFNESIRLTES